MKVLVCGDIHCRVDELTAAFNKFLREKYDKIIFLGDYWDSFDRSNNDMIRVANMLLSMKRQYKDQMILLIGNHDVPYLRLDPSGFRVAGFRPLLHPTLYHILAPQRNDFQYAYGIGNYLFTHAGVQLNWYIDHFKLIQEWGCKMGLDIFKVSEFWMVLDGIGQTRDFEILFECGEKRGGKYYEKGGPLWCDIDEILTSGPVPGFHQVVGHSPVSHIRRISRFAEGFHLKNTTVTFTDCLHSRTQFLTLNI